MNKYKNDLILVGVIIILGLAVLFSVRLTRKNGNTVKIIVDGQLNSEYSLFDNTQIDINGKNILVIEDGFAFVKAADCPDKICVSHKKISKKGETIVCLPNKVVIEIE